MNDLRKYSREFITEFIELYKSFPAVWKIKSKEYSNRDLKTQAYDVLVAKWKEVEPRADRDFVVKKINSMRTVYRRELKKMNNVYLGIDSEEVEYPNLWYFHLLEFLKDQKITRSSTSSWEHQNPQDFLQEIESDSEQSEPPLSPTLITPSCSTETRRAKKRPNQIEDSILSKISNQLDDPLPKLDRIDFITKAWAETLRSLPNHQRIYAEKIINDVLFEAQLNSLTRESQFQVQYKNVPNNDLSKNNTTF